MNNATYSTKNNAKRAARKQGFHLDLVEFTQTNDGRWTFSQPRNEGLDHELETDYGYVNCPHCGIHLENGVTDFESTVESMGSRQKALAVQAHQFACMGCGGEWGEAIPTRAKRSAYVRTGQYADVPSQVEGPVSFVHSWLTNQYNKGTLPATRREVIDSLQKLGINRNTATTQYGHWQRRK